MARAKEWKPTQRQMSEYDRLARIANKVRSTLLKVRKTQEQETPTGRLPALVVPKKHKLSNQINWRRIRKELGRQGFLKELKESRKLFGQGLRSYLRETFKRGYLMLWREHIGLDPEDRFGRYSPLQMREVDYKTGRFMQIYNRMLGMSPEIFYHMSKSGYLVDFKYIYAELVGKGDVEWSALDEQLSNINDYMRRFGLTGWTKDPNMRQLQIADVYIQRTFTRVAHQEYDYKHREKVYHK